MSLFVAHHLLLAVVVGLNRIGKAMLKKKKRQEDTEKSRDPDMRQKDVFVNSDPVHTK